MSESAAVRPSLGEKLMFFVWGIRYQDILVLMAYPTLGAVVAIRQPLPVPLVKLAFFSLFNFFFLAQIYIFNDWSDAKLNPDEPARRRHHALKRPALRGAEVLGIGLVFAVFSLAGFFFLSPALFVCGIAINVITLLYSHPSINLKGRPVISTLIHLLGAGLYFFGGFIAFSHPTNEGIALTLFFALVLAAGHFSNEIDDLMQDRAANIRTNAIAFGPVRVFRVGLILFLLSSALLLLIGAVFSNGFYAACGAGLLVIWAGVAGRFRRWAEGDAIRPFRRFYRVLYALLSAAMLLERAWTWWW